MNLGWLEEITAKRALTFLGAFIVVGGFALALYSSSAGTIGSFSPAGLSPYNGPFAGPSGSNYGQGYPSDYTQQVATTATTVILSTSTTNGNQGNPSSTPSRNSTGTGSLLEFSSDLAIRSPTPQQTASQVVAAAYDVGGYVAYQATYTDSAYVVIRVPAAEFLQTLDKVRAMGTFVSLQSNSNDVTVQYTDLNATLVSLKAEQSDLLRFLNQSANITTTLSIEAQLQNVNQQINSIQSQILQTKTLISYSTLDVTITKSQLTTPMSIVLKAAPENGTAPFSITFNAIVKGGVQPYLIIFNFGDGTTDQGQILVHTYYQGGDYKVTVTATDLNGTAMTASTKVHVDSPPEQSGLGSFLGTVSGLFIGVVEGIVEVAVVVLPLAAVGAVVVIPLRRRARIQKQIKQS